MKESKVRIGGGPEDLLQIQYEKELKQLWRWFEDEKHRIMNEECDKDIDEYYPWHDGIYYDNYHDHWRVEELTNKVYYMEDEIIERYKEDADALRDKLHSKKS